jgi:hypothetical protein
MTQLTALWLPILLSAVVVFLASSVIHMVLPFHRADYPKMPNEDRVMDALRPFNIPPGDYMAPRADGPKDMKSPEFLAKVEKGPVFIMTMLPSGQRGMGKYLFQWFIFSIIVGVFAAYIAGRALPPGAPYGEAFRFAGATAFIGYAVAMWPMSIWYHRSWGTTFRGTVDGLIYGLLTGGVFGALWPQ